MGAEEAWADAATEQTARPRRAETLLSPRVLMLVLVANAALALGGVVRDFLLARYFGLTGAADALNLAWFVADLCGNAVLACIVAAAAVPYLAAARPGGRREPARLGGLLVAVAGVAAVAALVLALGGPLIVHLIDASMTPATSARAVRGLRALAPYVLAFPLSAALAAELQVRRHFIVAAAAPLVTTVFIVAGVAWFGPRAEVVGLLRWIAAGAVAALAWPVGLLWRLGADLRPRRPSPAALRTLWRLGGPIGGWMLLTQLGQAVDRYFAGTLGPGGLSGISFAAKFGQAPTWVFAAAVTMMVYPALAEAGADESARRRTIERALPLIVLGSLPLAAMLGFGARPIVRLVLARGAFTAADAARVGASLAAMAAGIPAAAAATLFYRALFASRRARFALIAAGLTLIVGAVGDALLTPRFGLTGIGAADAAAQWVGALACWWLVRLGTPVHRGPEARRAAGSSPTRALRARPPAGPGEGGRVPDAPGPSAAGPSRAVRDLTTRGYWDGHWRRERKYEGADHIMDSLLVRHLPRGGDYLEVGCAPGATLAYFHRRFGYRVTGVDFSSVELVRATMARAGITDYRVVEADFLRWESEQRFDVVASFGFVEHFADVRGIVLRHARFVRPGGYLVLELPNLRYFNGLLHAVLLPRVLALHNRAAMRPKRITAPLLEGDAFEILHAGYFGTSFLDFDPQNPVLGQRRALLAAVRGARALLARCGGHDRPTAFFSPYIVVIARRRGPPPTV